MGPVVAVTALPEKRALLDAVIARLSETMATMAEAAQRTREGATHSEAKAEGDKDTRATEASYLARGQAMRVEDLLEQIQSLRFFALREFRDDEGVDVGALVSLESDEAPRHVFVLPQGGGTEVRVGATQVTVVTLASPLGAAIVGKHVGDDVELRSRGAIREYVIAAVR